MKSPDDILSTRRIEVAPLIRRERLKERILFGLILLLLAASAALSIKVKELKREVHQKEQGLYRSQFELISGGKRFIDYSYSIDSVGIELDRFRAQSMIVDDELRADYVKRLAHKDTIRKAKSSGDRSYVDWLKSTHEVLEETDDYLKVEYKGYLVKNKTDAFKFDIILFLTPVKKTDFNTDGVGVIDFIDVAKDPFKGENND